MSYECAKRPLEDGNPMNGGRLQKMMKKHPVAEINERYPDTKYSFEQEGECLQTTFLFICNGEVKVVIL